MAELGVEPKQAEKPAERGAPAVSGPWAQTELKKYGIGLARAFIHILALPMAMLIPRVQDGAWGLLTSLQDAAFAGGQVTTQAGP